MAPVGAVLPPLAHPSARWQNLNYKAVIILISATSELIYTNFFLKVAFYFKDDDTVNYDTQDDLLNY